MKTVFDNFEPGRVQCISLDFFHARFFVSDKSWLIEKWVFRGKSFLRRGFSLDLV